MSLLASLVRAYDRLPDAPPYGFSTEKIGFCVLLNRDGSVASVEDLRDTDKKRSPRMLRVPAIPKRAGSTPRPNFLWDNINYALGAGKFADPDDTRFDAFRDKHLEYLSDVDNVEIQTFCAFLRTWSHSEVTRFFPLNDIPSTGIVFASADNYKNLFLHQTDTAQRFWGRERYRWVAIEGKSTTPAICLVSGEMSSIARTHPPIKGMSGVGGKSEMALISFNDNAYESYGHEQGDNAPVSEAAAFAYTTVLNRYLGKDSGHRIQIGDASTVFWADASDMKVADEAEFWASVMLDARPVSGSDEKIAEREIEDKLLQLRAGIPLKQIAPELAEGVRFYVLGLSPNAARLSVRYYWEDSFGALAQNYAAYLRDVTLEPAPGRPILSIRAATLRTAPAGIRNGVLKYDAEHVSPLLSGELVRAIMSGGRFPRALLALLLMRVRSDHVLDRIRISLIKGLIVRDMRLDGRLPKRADGTFKEDYLMRPDADDPNTARRLGRLFAVIERIQSAALGDGLNTTVKDKFLGAAAATPARVFPTLAMNAERHHLKRLRNGHSDASWIKDADHARRVAIGLTRELSVLWSSFPEGVPQQHSTEEQGLFLVGYYQERYAARSGTDAAVKTDTTVNDDSEE